MQTFFFVSTCFTKHPQILNITTKQLLLTSLHHEMKLLDIAWRSVIHHSEQHAHFYIVWYIQVLVGSLDITYLTVASVKYGWQIHTHARTRMHTHARTWAGGRVSWRTCWVVVCLQGVFIHWHNCWMHRCVAANSHMWNVWVSHQRLTHLHGKFNKSVHTSSRTQSNFQDFEIFP